jgi:hypothetical protein
MAELTTTAETRATEATGLPAFNKLNLGGVKDEVEQVLSLIGRDGIFREYTLHDITHINRMLVSLDDLIPRPTATLMTPADWLLTVLAIYFHDMGLLVTEAEFAARETSGFRQFCDDRLFSGDDGAEYRSKVAALGNESDTFLYQEFVREHHAERIGDWIRGRANLHRGVSDQAVAGVAKVLEPLPPVFREDLAQVCESHHKNDIDDTSVYPVSQPYGATDNETANVQYAAVLLRVADLLHITQDRTPSTAFRYINPRNPISQREWAKQMAVRRVRPQLGKDEEGNLSEQAPQDTLEVHANFDDADGFFGLMAYLRYAREQLDQAHKWTRASQAQFAIAYDFPWRKLDDSRVSATGFLPQQLSFTLDQHRILELLTGHMLYNDTSVVIRELVQNAIDAVRLQSAVTGRDPIAGVVEVEWDEAKRELVVRDNGTGMSQEVIRNNLLKAGSSRYQEESFKKEHEGFSPISRFGIGVLSAFMIADRVEIVTCSPADDEARRLTLRSVHDRYLISLLDKSSDPEAARLAPHGTEVRLRVRDTAALPDVTSTLRRWVVLPRCRVTSAVNGGEAEAIGFESCGDAIVQVLREMGLDLYDGSGEPSNTSVRVVRTVQENVETAFAVSWNSYFREWAALETSQFVLRKIRPALGVCIEGIRVEELSAGFTDYSVVALCNATGHDAPKTNVARSGIEPTRERANVLRFVYDAYIDHVATELGELVAARGFSSTWAAQEADILLRPFLVGDAGSTGREVGPMEPKALADAVAAQPLMMVEDSGGRRLVAGATLAEHERLWTVDSAFVRAGESLLREIPSDASLAALGTGLGTEAVALPDGVTLVGYGRSSRLYQSALAQRQVGKIAIRHDQRRVDLAWDVVQDQVLWANVLAPQIRAAAASMLRRRSLWVAVGDVPIDGRQGEVAVRSHGELFLFADSGIAEYARNMLPRVQDQTLGADAALFLSICIQRFFQRWRPPDDMREFVENVARYDASGRQQPNLRALDEALDFQALVGALERTPLHVFDPSAWRRGEDYTE